MNLKKRVFSILFLTCTLSVFGQQKEASKMKQVIDLHDEVMGEMPKLSKLIGQLDTRLKETPNNDRLLTAKVALKKANTAMMVWMEGFGNRFSAEEMYKGKTLNEQKTKWIKEEEGKVKNLRTLVHTSIENAEKLLGNN